MRDSWIENFLFGLAISNFIIMISFVLAGFYGFSKYQENAAKNEKNMAAKIDELSANIEANQVASVTSYKGLERQFKKNESKLTLIEASLDPGNTRWAKIKKVRDVVKAGIEKFKLPKKMTTLELTSYASAVVDYSEEFDVPIPLILAMTQQESAFNPRAKSHADAHGIIQIIPSTAKEIAEDLGTRHYSMFKIRDNVKFGTYYIMKLLDEFEGDKFLAVRAYNCGPTCVHKVLAGEWSNYPAETRKYVEKILGSENKVCHVTDNECDYEEGYVHYYERMGL